MTDVLSEILTDVRQAAARDLRRRSRRRQLVRRTAAGCVAALTLSTGVAAATGKLPDFGDLLDDGAPATVTDLGEGRQRVVLDVLAQAAGTPVSAVVTDQGVSKQTREAPAGTAVCDSDGTGGLSCAGEATGTGTGTGSAVAEVRIPAGVRTYRVEPEGAIGSAERALYIPARRLLLIVVGTPPAAGGTAP